MNKLTDAEIIKALECCCKSFGNCTKCPYKEVDCVTTNGKSVLLIDALDLINRQKATIDRQIKAIKIAHKLVEEQKAEIEKLNVELVGMRGACESYKIHYDNAQAEIERFQKENEFHRKTITENAQRALEVLVDEIDKAKTEAIKEFEEKAMDEFKGSGICNYACVKDKI